MRQPPLEGQVQAYWLTCRDLRLSRGLGLDDSADIEELADLAAFTEHARLRAACLSQLRCDVIGLEVAS